MTDFVLIAGLMKKRKSFRCGPTWEAAWEHGGLGGWGTVRPVLNFWCHTLAEFKGAGLLIPSFALSGDRFL
jgi:hypothetical protein